EQPAHGLVPRHLGMVEELVPARALFGLRASAQDRDPERGGDVLAVHQEVRGAFRHGSTLRALSASRAPGGLPLPPWQHPPGADGSAAAHGADRQHRSDGPDREGRRHRTEPLRERSGGGGRCRPRNVWRTRSPRNPGGRVFVGRGDSSPECITAAFRGIVAAMSAERASTTIGGGERCVCGGARDLFSDRSSTHATCTQNRSSTHMGLPQIRPHFAWSLPVRVSQEYARRRRRGDSSSVLEVVEGVVPVGEFEEDIVDREDAVEGAQATPADAGPSRGSQAASGDRSPQWRVRARRELSEDYVLEEVEPGSREAARVLALHQSMKARARLYADHLEQLATFFREDPDVQGLLDEADVTALKVATGLRCTYLQAHAQVRDAHLAVEWMPHTFAHLRAGDLPEAWHHWLLRQVRRLTESQVRQVDADMAGVEIPSVSKATFDKHVGLAVARASADTPPSPPSKARDARIVDIDPETGTASLCVTGPIPEIQALAHRLDIAARTVQSAQRAGLEDGAEGPLPFDIDEDLRDRGTPLSLRALRYAILTHSILDIDPVHETRSPY